MNDRKGTLKKPLSKTRLRRSYFWVGFVIIVLALGYLGTEVAIWRGQACLAIRAHDRAAVWLRPLEWLRPYDPEVHFLLARLARRNEQYKDVEQHLQRANELGWDIKELQFEQELTLAQTGQFDQMRLGWGKLFERAGADSPEISNAYVNYSLNRFEISNARAMIAAWQLDYPNDPESYLQEARLAEVYLEWGTAAEKYNQAAELAPHRSSIYERLAFSQMKLGEFEQALATLKKVSEESTAISLIKAESLHKLNELDAAKTVLLQALEEDPESIKLKSHLAEISLDLNENDEALRLINEVIAVQPENHESRFILAKSLQRLGRLEEAKPHLEFVEKASKAKRDLGIQMDQLVQNPNDTELRYDIAMTYYNYTSRKEGVVWLQQLLKVTPGHVPTHRVLADYYASVGNETHANFHRQFLASQSQQDSLDSATIPE